MVSIDLAVDVHAESGRFEEAGTVVLRAPAAVDSALTLTLAHGAVAFTELSPPAGARWTLSEGRDTARILLAARPAAGSEVAVRFRARSLVARGGRAFAVDTAGAFASYFGNWYPWPAAAAGGDPDPAAAGRVRITVPAAWRTLSSGRMTDSASAAGRRTETWESRREIARSFVAAPFRPGRQRAGGIDVGAYLLPAHAARAPEYAAAVARAVEVLQRAYGPYPFETFGIAELPASLAPPGFGGRSEPGYFIAHTHALDGDGVDLPFFAHELAHMWWPNLVDSRPPGDDMVDEGMASHGAALVVEALHGPAAARVYLREGAAQFSARGFFHLWRTGGDERLMADYPYFPARSKGAWVYAMLRDRVGDEVFFGTLRRIARERRSLSLQELRDAFVRAAPADPALPRFFADWLDRPGAPVLDLAWERAAGGVRVRLAQRTAPYRLPLEIAIDGSAGRAVRRVELRDSVQSFVLAYAGVPRGVRIDPAHRLLLWEPEFGPVPGVTPPWTRARGRAWLASEIPWLMRGFDVTAASVAVLDSGRVAWSAGFGAPGLRIDSATIFPLGPFSPAVRAAGGDAARSAITPRPASAAPPPKYLARTGAGWGAQANDAWSSAPELARVLSRMMPSAAERPGADAGRDLFGPARDAGGLRLSAVDGAPVVYRLAYGAGGTALVIGFPRTGVGCVVLANDARTGPGFAVEVAQRLAAVYGWPAMPR
jgi:hypothetical protein